MFFVGLILFIKINILYGNICLHVIKPLINDIIICDNTCDTCNIICSDTNQCQNIHVYSGALTTNINCFGEGSCINSVLYVGQHFFVYPNGYTSSNFGRINYNILQIICTGKSACVGMRTHINGNFKFGGILNADSNGHDSFKDAYLYVSLLETQVFNLLCGLNVNNCYGSTQYICNSGNCQCNGETTHLSGGCVVLKDKFKLNSMFDVLCVNIRTRFCDIFSICFICIYSDNNKR